MVLLSFDNSILILSLIEFSDLRPMVSNMQVVYSSLALNLLAAFCVRVTKMFLACCICCCSDPRTLLCPIVLFLVSSKGKSAPLIKDHTFSPQTFPHKAFNLALSRIA